MGKFTKTLMAGVMALSITNVSHAETNDKEFAALAKILALSKDIPAGDIKIGVVYDEANASSKADFEAIKSIIGANFKGPKHSITLEPITVADVASKAATVPVVMVTEGVSSDVQNTVHGIAKSNKTLTVTTDISTINSGDTVLGVDVDGGTIKILMNGNAYKDIGLQFDAAFEFMVKEI